MVAKIISVFPLIVREYTDREGRTQTFKSKGYIFNDGKSEFYAEAVQEWAEHNEHQDYKILSSVAIHPTIRCRKFNDKEGKERYSNEITITAIMPL